MNNWLTELNTHVPAALTILFVTTAVLIAGLAVQHAVGRSPAVQHAVLLWTLIALGLCPILISATRLAPIPAPIASHVAVQRMNILLGSIAGAQTAHNGRDPHQQDIFHSADFYSHCGPPEPWSACWDSLAACASRSASRVALSRFQQHESRQRGAVCSPSLVAIFRGYALQIRPRFPWRWATFGLSSCFRRHCWTNWTTSSSCRC
jgi:hypothetical protein